MTGGPAGGMETMTPDGLLALYELTQDDLQVLKSFGKQVEDRMDGMIDQWYGWLKAYPEFDLFFSDVEVQERAQRLQKNAWEIFMSGRIDEDYVRRRVDIGEVHARIGLPLSAYFAGMNHFLTLVHELAEDLDIPNEDWGKISFVLTKLMHLESAVVVHTYNAVTEEALTAQAKSLMEMSTPVTEIWGGILLLPIVGIIDSHRAQDIMNAALAKIAETQARIFIMDISGVGVVDTAVANYLINVTRATRLMGCESTISGVSPAIAQTIVELGIDVGRLKTTATMQDALAAAFRRQGLEIHRAAGGDAG
jgi:rsbT co-antagonist protein RsbR